MISDKLMYVFLFVNIIIFFFIIKKLYAIQNIKKQNEIINLTDLIIKSNELIKTIPNLSSIKNRNNNIIISLTSIPPRILTDEFDRLLKNLKQQKLKPNYIVLNVCKKYNRNFTYDLTEYEKKIEKLKIDKDILINFCDDYGPATKAIGLYSISNLFDSDDIVICIDDDIKYSGILTYVHTLAYQLYNCESTAVDSSKNYNYDTSLNEIFYDDYKGKYYGWVSFSFKIKYLERIYNYYNNFIERDKDIITHDDLLFTSFFHTNNVYTCGINLYLGDDGNKLTYYEALMNLPNETNKRKYLENKYKTEYLKSEFISINQNIKQRWLLFNVENYSTNKYDNIHFDVKYYNSNTIILTLTKFNNSDSKYINIYFTINDNLYRFNINTESFIGKKTYFIKINESISPIKHIDYKFNILQTNKTNKLEILKYYSVLTILNIYPDMVYRFYDDSTSIKYLYSIDKRLVGYYNKLKPGAFKADLFRAIYLYYDSGFYLDCKFVAIQSLVDLIKQYDEFYCLDANLTGVYNAIMFTKVKKNKNLQVYINLMLNNIKNNIYGTSALHITGPGLLGEVITNDNIKIYYSKLTNVYGFVSNINTNIKYFLNNYSPKEYYYGKNNYLNTTHYGVMWKTRNVFSNEKVEDFKL